MSLIQHKILFIEDNIYDVDLVKRILLKSQENMEIYSVKSKEEYIKTLVQYQPDIILSDYKLPDFNGLEALKIRNVYAPQTPFIILTGILGDEKAVETLREGATDYVLKDNLRKLPQVISRALSEAQTKQKVKQVKKELNKRDKALFNIMEASPVGVFQCNKNMECLFANKRWSEITGINIEEALNNGWTKNIHPEDYERVINEWNPQKSNNQIKSVFRYKKADGTVTWVFGQGVIEKDELDQVAGFIGTITDITKLKQTEQELLVKNKNLEKINKELDNFVYITSHNLRAPLTSVLGLTNLLRLEGHNKEQCTKITDLIEQSVTKLDEFIKEILEFSRNSRLEFEPQAIDFDSFVQNAFSNFKYLDHYAKISKKTSIEQKITFYTDPMRLNIILRNLLSNCFKYTNNHIANPYIEIDIVVKEKEGVLKISDNGIGIDIKHLEKVFNMFYRADDYRSGPGLGLYIAKEAIEKLNGRIYLSSEKGKGTTIVIHIPNARKNGLDSIKNS